jgi:hypothetical protein
VQGKAVIIDAGRGVGEVAADVMSAFTTLEQRREVELSQPQVRVLPVMGTAAGTIMSFA